MINVKQRHDIINLTLKVVGIPFLILIWWLLSKVLGEYRVPSPLIVFPNFFTTITSSSKLAFSGAGDKGFLPHVLATVGKVVLGTGIGTLFGIFLGLLMMWYQPLRAFLRLPIDGLRAIPPLAFVPIFFMLFGRTPFAQIISLVLYSFLLIVINTVNAVENVPPIYQRFAYSLGASRGRMFRTVIFPAIVPELIGGVRVVIIWGWGLQVIIEIMGASVGIGKALVLTQQLNALELLVIGALWVVILAGIMDIIFYVIITYVIRWQPRMKKRKRLSYQG
jgi:NitT/TauT family transport system permease protein/taurine transport system permease protein